MNIGVKSTIQLYPNMTSRIRRKPQLTYKSPTAEDPMYIAPCFAASSSSVPSTSSKHINSSTPSDMQLQKPDRDSSSHHVYSPTPSLPLFHPLGRLALSLPPLDPTRYGLPPLPISYETENKTSSQVRKSAAKVPERDEEPAANSVASNSSLITATTEMKERSSPRKRRAGGSKRKRKDPDDGDSTYPAKRTRLPRGATGQANDDDSVVDIPHPDEVKRTASEALPLPDLSDSAKRRSTRANGSKRRDSSASETTSISGPPNAIPRNTVMGPEHLTSAAADADTVQKSDGTAAGPVTVKDDKEEGELSEEHPGT